MKSINFLSGLFVSLALLFAFSISNAFALENPTEKSLLEGNWKEVFKRLEKDETKAGDPVHSLLNNRQNHFL